MAGVAVAASTRTFQARTRRKPLPPHWYRIHIGECPVCGSDKSYRERVYGERPENIEDRYEYIPDIITFDNCIY